MTSSNNILFIDIETIGLPNRISFSEYYSPIEITHYDSSRIIEIGYIICNNTEIIKKVDNLIKPNNFTINNTNIHGITHEQAENEGKSISDVLDILYNDLDLVETVISHNSLFDINIILSECHRINHKLFNKLNSKIIKCTMKLGKEFMKSEKYPKLTELYKFIFNQEIIQEHRALSDSIICKDCYYFIIKKNENSL